MQITVTPNKRKDAKAQRKVIPFKQPKQATIAMPGSKSYTNRALIMAALTPGAVVLNNPLFSEDTEVMITALQDLGLRLTTAPNQIIVHDDISIIKDRPYELFVRDSGTTMRFLLALLCLTPGTKTIGGNSRLNQRPIRDLVEALRSLGANIHYLHREGEAPLKILSSKLHSNQHIEVNASMSSQFLSALMLIAPRLEGLTLKLQKTLISKPYVDMTIGAMEEWGIKVDQKSGGEYHISSGQCYQKKNYCVEGDYSSAGYFFAIAALTQSTLTLTNLTPDSAQADRKFLAILANMGNVVHYEANAVTICGKQIVPSILNMEECPDQIQTMAVLAAFAQGLTHISGVRSLRLKETDRIQALKTELSKMGIKTEDTHDTLTVYGGSPLPATIETYGDHRMAMAFAVAGTKLPGMKIDHPEVVNKTFPDFWKRLESL